VDKVGGVAFRRGLQAQLTVAGDGVVHKHDGSCQATIVQNLKHHSQYIARLNNKKSQDFDTSFLCNNDSQTMTHHVVKKIILLLQLANNTDIKYVKTVTGKCSQRVSLKNLFLSSSNFYKEIALDCICAIGLKPLTTM
jgi:hypothetical protein